MTFPFTTAGTYLPDLLRFFCAFYSLYLAFFALRIGLALRNTRQWGCYALVAFALNLVWVSVSRFGHPVFWPDVGWVVGLTLGCFYVWKVQSKEDFATLRSHRHTGI